MTIERKHYNVGNGEMLYILTTAPKTKNKRGATEAPLFSLAVAPAGKKNSLLSLWRGDGSKEEESALPIVDSDEIKLSNPKKREEFCEIVELEFGFAEGKTPPMGWLKDDLHTISKRLQKDIDEALRSLAEEGEDEYLELEVNGVSIWRTEEGYFFHQANEGRTQLWNATARISVDKMVDDGSGENKRYLILEVSQGKQRKTITVSVTEFDDLRWIRKHLHLLTTRPQRRNHYWVVRAIQEESRLEGIYEMKVFSYTGWRKVDVDQWGYLHSAGAIIAEGSPRFVGQVELDPKLARRRFPESASDEETRQAIRASFGVWDLPLPDEITIPLMAAIYRTAAGGIDFMVHLSGQTGAGKTSLARLASQFFGPNLGPRDQENYQSTPNRIEELAFTLKDQPLVVDEFQAHGVEKATFERIARALANRSGRGRMGEGNRPPRGLLLSTGEELPEGESVTARALVLSVPQGEKLDFYAPRAKIDAAQEAARSGVYALAMRAFIQWLAPRYAEVSESFEEARRTHGYAVAQHVSHARTAEIYGSLISALELWMEFAVESSALSAEERSQYEQRAKMSVMSAILDQDHHVSAASPAEKFRKLVRAAVEVGSAHLRAPTEDVDPAKHKGLHLGWLSRDGKSLYLRSERAFELARQGSPAHDPFTVSQQTLYESLGTRGYILSSDRSKKRNVVTVRRKFGDEQITVLHLKPTFLEVDPS
jgi:hypothetical protein